MGRPMNRERGAKEEATSPQSPPGASTSSQHNPQRIVRPCGATPSPVGGKYVNFATSIQSSVKPLVAERAHVPRADRTAKKQQHKP